jgi:transcriptional regulator with XRE-family HTH domain
MGRLADLRNELMHNPDFRAGYEQQSQLVQFGRMMREARESQGLTQAQLADRLAIHQSEISRLEKGEGVNGPTFERIVAVAHALELKLVVGFADDSVDTHAERVDPAGRPRPQVRRFGGFKRRTRARTAIGEAAEDVETLWGAF